MTNHRRHAPRRDSPAKRFELSVPSDSGTQRFGVAEHREDRKSSKTRVRFNPLNSPRTTPQRFLPSLTKPPFPLSQPPPAAFAEKQQKPHFPIRYRSFPPSGYLRQYELNRLQNKREEVIPWTPPNTTRGHVAHLVLRELHFPLFLARQGGVGYFIHLLGILIFLAASVSCIERIALNLLFKSGIAWELPVVIAPFLPLLLGIGLRLVALPVAIGISALSVRTFFRAGSLDLVTLFDTTPTAVRRCCSTSWLVTLKLVRRALAVIVAVATIIFISRAQVPPSIVLLLTAVGSIVYLIIRIPLLCAPLLSVVADYGRRYAVQQVSAILLPCSHKIRVYLCCCLCGWFVSHFILRSTLDATGVSPWPLPLWINLSLWGWYTVTCTSSVILHQAFLYERMMCQKGSSALMKSEAEQNDSSAFTPQFAGKTPTRLDSPSATPSDKQQSSRDVRASSSGQTPPK